MAMAVWQVASNHVKQQFCRLASIRLSRSSSCNGSWGTLPKSAAVSAWRAERSTCGAWASSNSTPGAGALRSVTQTTQTVTNTEALVSTIQNGKHWLPVTDCFWRNSKCMAEWTNGYCCRFQVCGCGSSSAEFNSSSQHVQWYWHWHHWDWDWDFWIEPTFEPTTQLKAPQTDPKQIKSWFSLVRNTADHLVIVWLEIWKTAVSVSVRRWNFQQLHVDEGIQLIGECGCTCEGLAWLSQSSDLITHSASHSAFTQHSVKQWVTVTQ